MKPVETGDRNVGELVKKIQMDEPKVGKVGDRQDLVKKKT